MVREEETGKQWKGSGGAIKKGGENRKWSVREELRELRSFASQEYYSPNQWNNPQSLHYFFLGFSVVIYHTVQCEDACIISVRRFSRQSHHLLSACLIVQWLLKACSNIPSCTRSHRMLRYTTQRWGTIQCISGNSREKRLCLAVILTYVRGFPIQWTVAEQNEV